MSKVLLIQSVLAKHNIRLEGKRIFDYGFGSGTFLRHCPRSSQLFGVELDPVNVSEVTAMLRGRGLESVCLEPIMIERWASHPLLQRSYDLVVCSHVLEHLSEPAPFLQRLSECLEEDGLFLGLVPINERKRDSHHAQEVTLPVFKEWLLSTRLELVDWIETDCWLYWIQPLFTWNSGVYHALAQAVSITLGLASKAAGYQDWFAWSNRFGQISRSKPTQAAFLLRRKR